MDGVGAVVVLAIAALINSGSGRVNGSGSMVVAVAAAAKVD